MSLLCLMRAVERILYVRMLVKGTHSIAMSSAGKSSSEGERGEGGEDKREKCTEKRRDRMPTCVCAC